MHHWIGRHPHYLQVFFFFYISQKKFHKGKGNIRQLVDSVFRNPQKYQYTAAFSHCIAQKKEHVFSETSTGCFLFFKFNSISGHKKSLLTLYTPTAVCIFSTLFSLHFLKCWMEELFTGFFFFLYFSEKFHKGKGNIRQLVDSVFRNPQKYQYTAAFSHCIAQKKEHVFSETSTGCFLFFKFNSISGHKKSLLTLYTPTAVCIFSTLFSLHFLKCWMEEFV